MRPLHWDLMTVAQRLRKLAAWDFDDLGGAARLVEQAWEDLPQEAQLVLRSMR